VVGFDPESKTLACAARIALIEAPAASRSVLQVTPLGYHVPFNVDRV
jgi:hypothetical protein